MDHPAQTKSSPVVIALGFILPIGSIIAVCAGAGLFLSNGVSEQRTSLMISGGGFLLACFYLIMTLCRARSRSRASTAISVTAAVLLLFGGGGVVLLQMGLMALASAFSPNLAIELQDQAAHAAVPSLAFSETGADSGVLPGSKWSNPDGGTVPIDLKWKRNDDGVLVTASTTGPVPDGQDGTSQTQQFLGVDTLGFPIDYFATEAKQPMIDVFGGWLVMFNEMVDVSAAPIISAAKRDGGRLPSDEAAKEMLAKAKKSFTFSNEIDGKQGAGDLVTFDVTSYTYARKKKDDRFGIQYAWSCDYSDESSADKVSGGPVTGVITINYTASGFMIMRMEYGKLQHPLYEVLEAYTDRSEADSKAKEVKTDSASSSKS